MQRVSGRLAGAVGAGRSTEVRAVAGRRRESGSSRRGSPLAKQSHTQAVTLCPDGALTRPQTTHHLPGGEVESGVAGGRQVPPQLPQNCKPLENLWQSLPAQTGRHYRPRPGSQGEQPVQQGGGGKGWGGCGRSEPDPKSVHH